MITFYQVIINKIKIKLIYLKNCMLVIEKIKATQNYNENNLAIKILKN